MTTLKLMKKNVKMLKLNFKAIKPFLCGIYVYRDR